MKNTRLFWHLVRFHTQLAPWWILPFMLFILACLSLGGTIGLFGDNVFQYDFHGRDQLMPFIYFFILAAQLTWGMRWGRNVAQNQLWTTGSYAYLFTRAIHRPTLYWAKLAVFLAICMLPLLPTLAWLVKSPDIRIQLSSSRQNEKTLALQQSFPDLKVQKSDSENKGPIITLSGASWDWTLFKLAQILSISLTVVWLCALSWRWPKVWIPALILFFLTVFTPMILMLTKQKTSVLNLFSDDERILIWTHGHIGIIIGILTILAALILWDTRRRFLMLPQYKGAMI